MTTVAPTPESPHPGMGFRQFVIFVAMMMATNALAIDSMLPALPSIGVDLGIDTANHIQLVITAYLLGFGAAQIIYGTLADRYGRRPVLLFGLSLYTVASLGAVFAGTFETMLTVRILQGVGAAAIRILAITIVRDCYAGRQMARVMSLVFIVFLAVPIVAPSVGQLIVLFAPWRGIFLVLCLMGAVLITWTLLRLPETLHPEDRSPLSMAGIRHAFGVVFSNRVTVGYMLAMTMAMGCLFSFVSSAEQIFTDTFQLGPTFTLIFAGIACSMGLSSLVNARIVERLGMRRVSHAALIGFLLTALLHAWIVLAGGENLITFSLIQAGMMFFFGLMVSNFNAMAMEPVGHVAGTASSSLGFVSTVGGALLSFLVGQSFDGTTLPLTVGFALLSFFALCFVLIAERGRLFHAHGAAGLGHPHHAEEMMEE
ncbi:multidrug effflux MFS transporter [Ancylobacter sp. MQZ15Z-1]|uniref:Bcr/CflA family efflux transporter n=1 Tax=Ancylobacter mangrovi TaxID=2972472 RepID=A0A9X2T2Y6_9HYPH|nr:multidrug effflux MFS transporter [Ancylobacter mangrovi]MCS0496417.1 multidrug effflux MFS transporter [Ancylobacter mangrovi]